MHRKRYENYIDRWIERGKNALLVTGARQTGKTYIIRDRLKAAHADYVEINLLDKPEAALTISQAKNAKDLLLRLTAVAERPITPGHTIFFIDEIQEVKDFVTQIKFPVDEGSYRYILSGSLLGVELSNLKSAPVGYMTILDMYPMDLEEFCTALGMQDSVLSHIRDCFEHRTAVDDIVHEKMLNYFYLYQIVGGMPQAVQEYLDTNDLNRISIVQRDIVRLYHEDFSKYEKNNKLNLIEIYESMASELADKGKRFRLNSLYGSMSYDKAKNSFLWLKNAGVAIPVYNVTEPALPLEINTKRTLFKLFYSDVGLLTSIYSGSVRLAVLNREKNINNGALFENCVAQELLAHGIKSYYYNNKKFGELDFVIEWQGKALPIEVKSGKDYKRHVALENVLAIKNYGIEEAFILSGGNLEVSGKKVYLPIYMIMFLSDDRAGELIYKLPH